ncbi:unnamed protein product, partial [Rotaria sp. Silwood1]
IRIDERMSTDDIHILSSSSDSPILISSNSSSTSSNQSLSSSSVELTSYSSERIYYLLKNEKQQYTIIKNKVSPPVGSYWSIFGFPAKLNKKPIWNDIRPVSTIEDDGLRALVQECIRLGMDVLYLVCTKCIFLGSIYGNIEVNDILRCRSTISSHIQIVTETCRARNKKFLEEPYKNGCLSISPDFYKKTGENILIVMLFFYQ